MDIDMLVNCAACRMAKGYALQRLQEIEQAYDNGSQTDEEQAELIDEYTSCISTLHSLEKRSEKKIAL